jgi:N-dimethylarginine dimethylaminohydrolase
MINKEQTFELLKLIKDFYEQFEITQSKLDSWHLVIKDCELETVKNNLLLYCKENVFPPKVADLIKEKSKIIDRMNAIPNVEETRQYLVALSQKTEYTDEQLQSIEISKAQIRKILGIG